MSVWNWFNKQYATELAKPLQVDIHSHLIPGIDDGVQSIDESLNLIKGLCDLGYKKIITTPHIIQGTFNNTPEIIAAGLEKVQSAVNSAGMQVDISFAAEYYLDDNFIEHVLDEKVLSFGPRYVLFELPVMSKPPQLEEVIFELNTRNYIPVLAHPERYIYMHTKGLNAYEKLKNQGALLQVNLLSPIGYYSKPIQKVAQELIKYGWIDLVGTDMHNARHLDALRTSFSNKHIIELLNQPQLLNNQLLSS